MRVEYDEVGDILYIERVPPYREQESHEIDTGIIARSNPVSGEVESVEIQGLRKRHTGEEGIQIGLDLAFGLLPVGRATSRRRAV